MSSSVCTVCTKVKACAARRTSRGPSKPGFTLSSSVGRLPLRGEFLHPLKRLRECLFEHLLVLVGGAAIDDERRALSVVLQRVFLKRSRPGWRRRLLLALLDFGEVPESHSLVGHLLLDDCRHAVAARIEELNLAPLLPVADSMRPLHEGARPIPIGSIVPKHFPHALARRVDVDGVM